MKELLDKPAGGPTDPSTHVLPVQIVDQNGIAQGISGTAFTLFAAGTRTTAVANQAGTAVFYGGKWKRLMFVYPLTATAGAVGDTIDVYVDISFDNINWYNAVHFTQAAGNASAITQFATLDTTTPGAVVITITSDAASGVTRPALFGAYLRGRYTLVDAGVHGQSVTFSLTGYGV